MLGFYISGHPLDDYASDLAAFQIHTIGQVKETPGEMDTRLCGLITKVEIRLSQKDKTPWARVVFEDLTGAMEVLVFQPLYGALSRPLNVGDVVVISGQVDRRDDEPKLRASEVLWLPEAHDKLLQELILHLPIEDWLDPARWAQLREMVMDVPGPVKLRLVCSRGNGNGGRATVELAPADHYGITWTPAFKVQLEGFLKSARYELRATTQITRQKRKAWQQRG